MRAALGKEFELSWTVPWLEPAAISAELSSLSDAVDWFAVQMYGQPPGALDEPSLWDLAGAEDRLVAATRSSVAYGWSSLV